MNEKETLEVVLREFRKHFGDKDEIVVHEPSVSREGGGSFIYISVTRHVTNSIPFDAKDHADRVYTLADGAASQARRVMTDYIDPWYPIG